MVNPPNQADIVIIGGGIVGCSVAYHLTELGLGDVLLFERKQLTCGTTWHASLEPSKDASTALRRPMLTSAKLPAPPRRKRCTLRPQCKTT